MKIIFSVGLVGLISAISPAYADEPFGYVKVTPERSKGRFTVDAHTSFSFIRFKRPDRACGLTTVNPDEEAQDPQDLSCPAADSNELAVGFGFGVAFEVREPFQLRWGLDITFTDPEFDILEPQTMITMPFGIIVTWNEWALRPIIEGTATPFALLPDGVKSVMFGGRVGGAVRLGDIDLALTLGYSTADELSPWEIRLAVLHIP